MKRLLTLIILLNTVLFSPALASHLRGGEITWECQGNGQYIFQLKMYTDCNSITLNPVQSLCTQGGCPVTNIPLTLITDIDLTPPGCGNSCANPNGFGGAIREYIFQSNPVTLAGSPPATGWIFVWSNECCRNSVDNVNVGTGQMALRSIMYPDPNATSTNPCFDNSPGFANTPVSFICPGYPFSYNAMAIDIDRDSLSYAFDYPTDDNNNCTQLVLLNFIFPYTVNSQIPGNPAINPITGEFTVFPTGAVAGNYATCTRVDAYRCGVKIASVFREIQMSISSGGCDGGCDGTGNNQNDPPSITPAPFQNTVTGLYTDYADTVLVGDTVSFNLNVFEFEFHVPGCGTPNAIPQSFYINMSGAQVDSGSVAPYVNCNQPPCAYLNFPTPAGPFTLAHPLTFTWIPDCGHATNDCSEYNSYFFEINAKDDACPAPALNSKTFEVVIRGLHIIANGDTLSVNTPYTNLQWYLNGTLISGATDDTIITSSSGGYYTVQALTPAGCSIESNRIGIVHVANDEMSSSLNNLTLYPNPASGILHVEIKAQVAETVQLKITDGLGRELKHEVLQLNNGNNSLTVKTNDLLNGLYTLTITGKQNNYRAKFLVLK